MSKKQGRSFNENIEFLMSQNTVDYDALGINRTYQLLLDRINSFEEVIEPGHYEYNLRKDPESKFERIALTINEYKGLARWVFYSLEFEYKHHTLSQIMSENPKSRFVVFSNDEVVVAGVFIDYFDSQLYVDLKKKKRQYSRLLNTEMEMDQIIIFNAMRDVFKEIYKQMGIDDPIE